MVILFVELVDFEIRHLRCANHHQLAQDSDAHGDRSNTLIPFGVIFGTNYAEISVGYTTNQYE
jgi:hypothetical protein